MDTWLKAKAEKLAQTAQQHLTDLEQSASQLTQGVLQHVESSVPSHHKEIEFGAGPLGFRLEGTLVVYVDDSQQACSLGVEVGDRLVAVDGYDVPNFGPDDLEGEQRAKKLIKKWMREMPRPATLTFASSVLSHVEDAEESCLPDQDTKILVQAQGTDEHAQRCAIADNASQSAVACAKTINAVPTPASYPEAEVHERSVDDTDEVQHVNLGDETAQTVPAEATSNAIDHHEGNLQSSGAQSPTKLSQRDMQLDSSQFVADVADQTAAELPRQLEGKSARCRELDQARHQIEQLQGELMSERRQYQKKISELQKRERVLADEVTRLSQSLLNAGHAATQAALERAAAAEVQVHELEAHSAELHTMVKDLTCRATEAETRASCAEQDVVVMKPQLERYHEVHEAEIDMLQKEHAKQLVAQQGEFEARLLDIQQQAAQELERATQEVSKAELSVEEHRRAAEAARVDAQAAAVEARAARQAAAEALVNPSSDDEQHQIETGLTPQNDALERRGRLVQPKRTLRSDAAIIGPEASPGQEEASVALQNWITARVGPRAGLVGNRFFQALDQALRGFTQRLLKRDMWLYMFYAHLLVLYTISASCYAQSSTIDSGAPVDSIAKQMSRATGAPHAG
mmetsp:Transcript_124550/g.248469  ORF Transcript_124550/g.248469 Transcript_124550/m.248469 type:complete len:630 (+) Transcript_124550:159-2048(+)